MGEAVFPPSGLAPRPKLCGVEIMKSSKGDAELLCNSVQSLKQLHEWSLPQRDSWTSMSKSGSVFCGGYCSFLLGPSAPEGFLCALQESVFPVLWKFCNQIPLASKSHYRGSQSFADPQAGKSAMGPRRLSPSSGRTSSSIITLQFYWLSAWWLYSWAHTASSRSAAICASVSLSRPLLNIPLQETLSLMRQSLKPVSCGSSGSSAHKVFWASWTLLVWCGLNSKCNVTPPIIFFLGHQVSLWWIQQFFCQWFDSGYILEFSRMALHLSFSTILPFLMWLCY